MAAPTATPIPPSNTPSPTVSGWGETPQNQGKSIATNQQSNQPRQEPTAAPTSTSTATPTAASTATPTATEQSQNQPTSRPSEPPGQQLTPPKQSTATPTVELARQHGGTATHTPAPHPDRVALEAIYDALDGDDWTKTTAGRQIRDSTIGTA